MRGNAWAFDPGRVEPLFHAMLEKAQVPIVWTDGVDRVDLYNRQIKGFTTTDGHRAVGRVFIDASYEGDLLARANVSHYVGREASSQANPLDGYRGTDSVGMPQRTFGRETISLSPFTNGTEGDLLPTVKFAPDIPRGAADKGVQAYCFRLTMTNVPGLRVDLPSTPPDGYNPQDHELLFRMVDVAEKTGLRYGSDWSFARDLIKADEVAPGVYDVNSRGAVSMDAVGLSWPYPDASYAERKRIWKAHEVYQRGFLYALGHSPDPRIPAKLRDDVRAWGLVRNHYMRPRSDESAGWPYQLYVREARRLSNGVEWSGSDLEAADRSPLRVGQGAVAMANYMQDSHYVQRLAVKGSNGEWTVKNEGTLGSGIGGKDFRSPLPYDIMLPHEDELTNLIVPFCVASSHQAFSAIRMEPTSMALGEASGVAAAIAVSERDPIEIQKVPYGQLASLLRANGGVLDERSLQESLRLSLERRFG